MKFISKHGKSEKDVRNLRQEIGILRKLNHENIILMFDAFETDREFCVVTEYAQGELFDILQDDQRLPESTVQQIAKQLVKALHYLHSNRIIHRYINRNMAAFEYFALKNISRQALSYHSSFPTCTSFLFLPSFLYLFFS
jgi:serine/threonine protein kinase